MYAGSILATTDPCLRFSPCCLLRNVSQQQQNIELEGTLCWDGSDRLLRWCQQLFGRVSGRAWRSFAYGQRDLGLGATRSRSTWTVHFCWRLYHPRALIGLASCTVICEMIAKCLQISIHLTGHLQIHRFWNLCLSFARNQQYPGAFFFAGLEAGYLAAMRDLEGWWVIVKHRHQNSLWRVRGSLSSCWMNSKEDSEEDLTKFRNLKMIILFLYCVCKYIIKHKITLHNMNKSNNII